MLPPLASDRSIISGMSWGTGDPGAGGTKRRLRASTARLYHGPMSQDDASYPARYFQREDLTDDARFYDWPRMVVHITASHFHLDHRDEVQEIFPEVERYEIKSALVFREAPPAISFYASNRIDLIEERPADGSHRPILIRSVFQKIQDIIDRDGAFRVSKSYGYFTAQL